MNKRRGKQAKGIMHLYLCRASLWVGLPRRPVSAQFHPVFPMSFQMLQASHGHIVRACSTCALLHRLPLMRTSSHVSGS